MARILDDQSVDIPCPNCGHDNRRKIRWLKANKILICAACRERIHLESKQFLRSVKDAEKAVDDFARGIKRLDKRP